MSIAGRIARAVFNSMLVWGLFLPNRPVLGQTGENDRTGTCNPSQGEAMLEVNNVRARIPNNGQLFFRGEPHIYSIPRGSNANAIFAGSVWIGGVVDGVVRVAATRYGPSEFWSGPLDDDGLAPGNCSPFDRMFKISAQEIESYGQSGSASTDLKEWPTGLGAPTLDAEGEAIYVLQAPFSERGQRKIDLQAGERPDVYGDQTLWWIMNDRGNTHSETGSASLGLEVHGLAYASSSDDPAVNDATFYRFTMINRTQIPMTKMFFGLYIDPDLGNPRDDYIGSDSTRSLGYVYNADNNDDAGEGYGEAPPAVGVRILRGPIADDDGFDNDRDGQIDEQGERPGMSHFHTYSGGGCPYCNPQTGPDYYHYMQSIWKNGDRVREGSNGVGEQGALGPVSHYFYPGDPVSGSYWSEMNVDGQGTASDTGDRLFVLSSGPFDLAPDQAKTIDFAIVYGRGADHLDSVRAMREASDTVQKFFDANFGR